MTAVTGTLARQHRHPLPLSRLSPDGCGARSYTVCTTAFSRDAMRPADRGRAACVVGWSTRAPDVLRGPRPL
eukprot:3785053-Prymnesium_polylepis.1